MSYFNRNGKWLNPLVGICILTLTPMLLSGFNDSGTPSVVPAWMLILAKVGIVLGAFSAAIGACFTDTLSGHVVRVALPGLALGVMLASVGVTGSHLIFGVVVLWLALGGLNWRYRKV